MQKNDLKKLENMQILLVDDDESIRSSMSYYFKKKTAAFLAVESAEVALEVIGQEDWNIIISDYQLPGMNGIDLLNIISRQYPGMMKILITAYANLDVATAAIKAGIHDFIQKPFGAEAIISSLEFLIEKHEKNFLAPAVNGKKLTEIEEGGWKQKTEFIIGMIAHQINNSLQALQGNAELGLLTSEGNFEAESRFSEIIRNINTVNELNDELRSFGDGLTEKRRPTDIVLLLEHCIAIYNGHMSNIGIRIIEKFKDAEHLIVDTQKKALTQIIDNILINAIQALMEKKEGEETIIISAEKTEESVHIHIADSGPGMDAETLDKIKTKGFTTKAKGTGLGVYIVDRLIAGIGATMHVQSAKGIGTRFEIRLPTPSRLMQEPDDSPVIY